MNRYINIALLLILMITNGYAQYSKPADFIPEGYLVFEKYFGDLNKDEHDDCVLIIKKVDDNNIVKNQFDKKVDRNRRGIIVLFKNENGYEIADKNYDCFSSENEDGGVYFAPELWIDFKRGNLIVHYGHGRYGYWSYVFRFQESCFKLIGYDSSNNRGPVINSETSINFLTKKKLIRENINPYAESGEEKFKETWSRIEINNLIKLSDVIDFDELELYN